MIRELAEIDIKSGHEGEFEAAVARASRLFLEAKGCRSFMIFRSMEQPSRYRMVIEWETIEDHMVEFRNSDAFLEWRRLAGPHFASTPRVEHLTLVSQDPIAAS